MNGINVLIVDDNQDNKMTLELLLEDFDGLTLDDACDGQEAVDKCRTKHYHLIFMDLMMPVMDGIEATRQIREFDKKAMIIAVTALDDDKSKEKMILYGAEDFIVKPIDSKVFAKRVRNYLEILHYRQNRSYDNEAVNLFDKQVYNRSTVLRVFDYSSLSEFWEYFLSKENKVAYGMSEGVRILYAFGAWLLKNGHRFTYVSEESDDYLFLSQTGLDQISETVIKHLLLKEYDEGAYLIKEGLLTLRLPKVQGGASSASEATTKKALSEDEQQVLRKTHLDKTTAVEFVQSSAIGLMDKIEALEALEDRVDQELFEMEGHQVTKEEFCSVADALEEYNEVIDAMIEFQHLAFAIESLIQFLRDLDENKLKDDKTKKMILLLTNMISDLASWRKTIFIKQEANDIHYLDSSLLSSCLQIEMIFNENEVEDEDDNDLELF